MPSSHYETSHEFVTTLLDGFVWVLQQWSFLKRRKHDIKKKKKTNTKINLTVIIV